MHSVVQNTHVSEIESRRKFLHLHLNVSFSIPNFENFLETAFALCTGM
jgi:hypothetical protein